MSENSTKPSRYELFFSLKKKKVRPTMGFKPPTPPTHLDNYNLTHGVRSLAIAISIT